MNDLAQAFFHEYRQRLANGLPQQTNPAASPFWSVPSRRSGSAISLKTAAIELVERQGFSDDVSRFHTVNRDPIPLRL